jgi:hypothetical protein
MRSMVEGAHADRVAPSLKSRHSVQRWAPSTPTVRVAVPLPVPGRIYA